MEVVIVAPLRAVAFVFQPFSGTHALTVVQKLTFVLAPEVCPLAPDQEPIHEEELHWDDDPRKSLFAPSDVAPFKRRADVLLVGSAFAPGGRPVRTLTVRLAVAGMEKTIEVHGPRLFTLAGELREGAAFTRMPLRYERAAGGPDTWNPAGVWLDGPRDPYGQRHLPNLQPPGVELREVGQFVPPIGLGPIASTWPLRVERLHGRADVASPLTARRVPLSDDFDPAYFQDAPADQQVAALRPDETLLLEHLHPERERLVTRLPGLRPRAILEIPGEPPLEVPLTADTLWIDTDHNLCTLTFRGHVALADPSARGRVRVQLLDEEPPEATTEDSLPVLTAEMPVAPSPRRAPSPSIDDVVKEITAVEPPSPAPAALPFAPPAAPPDSPSPRGKTLVHGSARTSAQPVLRGVRRNTEEVVLPPGGLAGPSWLGHGERQAPPPPPPPPPNSGAPLAPPSFGAPPLVAPNLVGATPGTPNLVATPPLVTPSLPSGPAAPSPVFAPSLVANPPVALGDLSSAALAQSGPILRSQAPAPEVVKLGDVDEKALRGAASVGVLSASNAAAGPAKRTDPRPAPEADPAPENKPEASYLELLHPDKTIVPRLRAHKVFSAWMRPPPKAPPTQQGKPPPPPPTPEAIEKAERADVHHILSKDPQAAADSPSPEADADADPPLILAQGTLSFPFDELDTLKLTVAAARPLASSDKKLKEALDLASELLRSDLETIEAADAITARIREAWSRVPRPKDSPSLEARVEQKLLEERKYQRRSVLDAELFRALLLPPTGDPVVAYLPVKLEKRLPLFARFPVKLLAELYPTQDPSERSPVALKIVALARVTPRPRIGK